MEISEQTLRERYSEMSSKELVEMNHTSDLTSMATSVLNEILSERGITAEKIDNFTTKLDTTTMRQNNKYGFLWWTWWAILNLSLGNLYLLWELNENIVVALILIFVNSVVMIYVLKYNKYAFLFATVASLNPILWIINGVYLQHRWNHPKINKAHLNKNGKVSEVDQS